MPVTCCGPSPPRTVVSKRPSTWTCSSPGNPLRGVRLAIARRTDAVDARERRVERERAAAATPTATAERRPSGRRTAAPAGEAGLERLAHHGRSAAAGDVLLGSRHDATAD